MAEKMIEIVSRLLGDGSLETKEDASVKLIVGLGNPGPEYDQTRHNVGFMVLDALAGRFGTEIRRRKFNALTEEVADGPHKLLLLKPQQYMNRSGRAAADAAGFYKLSAEDILVVTDDLALDVGRLRLRPKGSAGGHNGLKDLIAALGTDAFARLRVGIGSRGSREAADYVLSRFSPDERTLIEQAVRTAVEAVLCWVREGSQAAMTRFNAKADEPPADKPGSSKER
jgi:PTH1 family peptidyl-tRNA hydrolase